MWKGHKLYWVNKWINLSYRWILINVNWLGTMILSPNLILYIRWDGELHVMNLLAKLCFQVFETGQGLLGIPMRLRGKKPWRQYTLSTALTLELISWHQAMESYTPIIAAQHSVETKTPGFGASLLLRSSWLCLYLWTHILNLKMRLGWTMAE